MSIIERIRKETRHLHDSVENEMPIMRPDFGLSGYRRLVARFYGFYNPAENQLWQAPGIELALPDWRERRKLDWLLRDLTSLGFTKQEIADLPSCRRLPELTDAADAMGCLYVLEGSTLGGQLIGRHLRATLRLGPENGACFFRSYGDRTGSMWKAFQAALLASPPEAQDRIVTAAIQTFECMREWLTFEPVA